MKIELADGEIQELESGATGADLAKKIKKSLNGNSPLAVEINGTLRDLKTALTDGDKARIVTFADDEGRDLFWHSSAHLLAHAIHRLYPDAKPTIGPPIETGFYYDFADLEISEEDFERVEDEMRKIVKERLEPQRIEYASQDEALAEFKSNKFKVEMIQSHEEGTSAYRQGDFTDMCTGPHIPNTSLVQALKIMKTSGAYWRGNAENEQLTRIYAVSYPDKKQLSAYLRFLEEAKKRDHRVVGKKLDLFSFHTEAPGMPFFHPKGMVIRDELIAYEKGLQDAEGYVEIKTPIMMSSELWKTSGHWDYYRENMYVSDVDEQDFAIKPMNCPGCMLYYLNSSHSYRELPLRIGEVGLVHRHEMSGALSGLFRVRAFHQDDSHIFMTPEQLKDEIRGVLKLAERIYAVFGLEYHMELSTKPEKAIGEQADWDFSTDALRKALDEEGYEYRVNEGDGAFYGPKIDMHIKDTLGRTWQCGTIQLDMTLPSKERFNLVYDDADGEKKQPIMLHRAIYGSIERFMGILIEHYAGKFPLWLSPVQIRVLTVADRHDEYAAKTVAAFRAAGLRADMDMSSESINKKVRNAQLDQVNYILVVGDKEVEAGNVNVRTRGNQVLGERSIEAVSKALREEYDTRAPEPLLK